jgi:Sap, sulfolipid-1-addressing protein
MLIGALAGIPGVAYLSALNNLVTGESSTAAQVAAAILFVLIEFALIIIPFAFLLLRPQATRALLNHAQDWLLGHSRQLIAYTAVILGAYIVPVQGPFRADSGGACKRAASQAAAWEVQDAERRRPGASTTRTANLPGSRRTEHAHQRRHQNWPFCAPHPLRTDHRPPSHTRQGAGAKRGYGSRSQAPLIVIIMHGYAQPGMSMAL